MSKIGQVVPTSSTKLSFTSGSDIVNEIQNIYTT